MYTLIYFKLKRNLTSPKEVKTNGIKKSSPYIIKMLGEYFWIVGLSLLVVGATLIWKNPLGIFLSGLILFLIGVVIKTLNNNNS